MLLDKAQLLDLTASEMVVLIAGFRSLGISYDGHGILSQDTNKLSNEFLVKILDMKYEWVPVSDNIYNGIDRETEKNILQLLE